VRWRSFRQRRIDASFPDTGKTKEPSMRTLIKIKLPNAAYNRAVAAGSLGKVWQRVFAECPPEATYYLTEDGRRAVYVVIDLKSADQMAAVTVPLQTEFEAEVEFVPVMSFADLEKGLIRAGQ
jgi:hypothetical protein